MQKNVKKSKTDFWWAFIPSLIGLMFIIQYIFMASMDIPTSDYIRSINYYINDVFDIKKFLVPDIVARVPITYLFRIINVSIFKYSMYFDRVVGAIALAVFNFIVVRHVRKKLHIDLLKNIASIVLSFMIMSLMSWEMILNGTGYTIFIFFALTAIIYEIYDSRKDCIDCIGCKDKKKTCKGGTIGFILLIIFTCLCTGSDYQVALIGTIIFFSLIYFVYNIKTYDNYSSRDKNTKYKGMIYLFHNRHFILIIVSLFCFIIYYISNHVGEVAEYTYVGMHDISLIEVLTKHIGYCFNFVIKSFASIIIGVETFEYALILGSIKEIHIVLVGIAFLVIIIIVIAFVYIKKIYKKDMFSIMLLFHGLASVGLVFIARYAYMNDHYGMSSRYAVQFMLLPVGIVLVFANVLDNALCIDNKDKTSKKSSKGVIKNIKFDKLIITYIVLFSMMTFFMLYGRVITSLDEINKTRARHFCYESAYNLAHHIDEYPASKENDELLMSVFEYRRGANLIRDAFDILKKNHLNIYK